MNLAKTPRVVPSILFKLKRKDLTLAQAISTRRYIEPERDEIT
jgi:hypothetical protein